MPRLIDSLREDGVIGGALKNGKLAVNCINPRDFTHDQHHTVDDTPYGGGPGMVLKPEPLAAAIDAAKERLPQAPVWYMSVDGEKFEDATARATAQLKQLIIVCGRYQGIDERIVETRIDRLVSLGDFIVSGGELPAMMIIDAVGRFLPDVLGNAESLVGESFAGDLLAPPCYTRPAEFEGLQVPDVLLSGNHQQIETWRGQQAQSRTDRWQQPRKKKNQ